MINEIKKDAQRAHAEVRGIAGAQLRSVSVPARRTQAFWTGVMVPYYGADTPIKQVANITVKDARTLQVVAFERNMLGAVDKAIR